jgi:hypothetical protein
VAEVVVVVAAADVVGDVDVARKHLTMMMTTRITRAMSNHYHTYLTSHHIIALTIVVLYIIERMAAMLVQVENQKLIGSN